MGLTYAKAQVRKRVWWARGALLSGEGKVCTGWAVEWSLVFTPRAEGVREGLKQSSEEVRGAFQNTYSKM